MVEGCDPLQRSANGSAAGPFLAVMAGQWASAGWAGPRLAKPRGFTCGMRVHAAQRATPGPAPPFPPRVRVTK